MKQSIYSLLLIALISISAKAQKNNTDLFFNYKKSQITNEHKTILNKLLKNIKLDSETLTLSVYCDSIGGLDYNDSLGLVRGEEIKKYLVSKKVKESNILINNFGSGTPLASNETEATRRLNRRVIVSFGAPKVVAPKVNQDSLNAEAEKLRCAKDTMVQLSNGIWAKLNLCEFENTQSCFDVQIITTPEQLKDSKMTTMSKEGKNLSTNGILKIKTCGDTCLVNSLKIYVPVNDKCKPVGALDVFISYSNNMWNSKTSAAVVEVLNNNSYYVYETKCSGTVNFAFENLISPVFKLKAKGFKFTEVKVYYTCEMGVFYKQLATPAKKLKMSLPCPNGDIHFDVIGVNKKGEEVKMEYLASTDVKAKSKQKVCTNGVVKKKFTFVVPK